MLSIGAESCGGEGRLSGGCRELVRVSVEVGVRSETARQSRIFNFSSAVLPLLVSCFALSGVDG